MSCQTPLFCSENGELSSDRRNALNCSADIECGEGGVIPAACASKLVDGAILVLCSKTDFNSSSDILDYPSSEKVEDERKAYFLKIAHEVLEYAEIKNAVVRGAQLGIDLLYFRPSLQNLDKSLEIGIFKITASLRICLLLYTSTSTSFPRKSLYLEQCPYFFLAHLDAEPVAQLFHFMQIQLLIYRSTVLPVHLLPKLFARLEVIQSLHQTLAHRVKTSQAGVPDPEYVKGRRDEVYCFVIAIAYVDDANPTFVACWWQRKLLPIV